MTADEAEKIVDRERKALYRAKNIEKIRAKGRIYYRDIWSRDPKNMEKKRIYMREYRRREKVKDDLAKQYVRFSAQASEEKK